MSPVSACASKWIIDTRPWPSTLAQPLRVRIGDRVVAAEGDRDRAGPDHLLHCGLQRRQRGLDVSGVHLDVTRVVDREVAQPVDPQGQRGPGTVVRQVVGACRIACGPNRAPDR